jgi:hypothetical protein
MDDQDTFNHYIFLEPSKTMFLLLLHLAINDVFVFNFVAWKSVPIRIHLLNGLLT